MLQEQQQEQQIERLLGYPGVGPLATGAIAKNIGTSEQELQPILDRLFKDGRVRRLEDGHYSAPANGPAAQRR